MSSLTPVGYKMLQSVAVVAALFLVSFSVMELAEQLEMPAAAQFCDDAILQSSTSPNGKWMAEVHFSNCSLEHPRSWKSYLHLTNLYSGHEYPATMVINGRQDALRLEWALESVEHAGLKVAGVKLAELAYIEQPKGVAVEIVDPLI
ncbi:hypothetical protein HR45_19100 [Shewanella mangrovi]|uniref:Uncharacterized protein n=1 Tax=Shewanella mangrovi TaxID=1515746 RepID=A0A094LLE9_9GAMM|nr:hypothetical protein [Shewanella mangrovi]KFZ35958.1 hypothetical protein HR45_19100 [Shewanella mangrovi]